MYRPPPLLPPPSAGESGVLRAAKWSASEPHYLITSTAKTAKTQMIREDCHLPSVNVDVFLLNHSHFCLFFIYIFLT